MKNFEHVANELLSDLACIVSKSLKDANALDEDEARLIGIKAAIDVAKHWGGQNLYIPQGLKIKIASRDEQVWAMFTGNNQKEIALHLGISEQWTYKIIRRMREINKSESNNK